MNSNQKDRQRQRRIERSGLTEDDVISWMARGGNPDDLLEMYDLEPEDLDYLPGVDDEDDE